MSGRRHAKYTLDISRLLSRAGHAVPSGIDRVELAYAEHMLAHAPERTEFAALHPLGVFGTVNFDGAARFIRTVSSLWTFARAEEARALLAGRRALHRQILLRPAPRVRANGRNAYMLLSHHHLTRPNVISRTLARDDAAFVPMVHDLIPSEYPEYARPREADRHRLRIETVARFAHGVIVPSTAVRQSILPYFARAGRSHVPVLVISHGANFVPSTMHMADEEAVGSAGPDTSCRPYFVCLGTIEPRKNHLLLLNIWRRLVERHGAAAPGLILIGRRGWENENVVDMIERCPALQGVVEEHNQLPDRTVRRLLLGAKALLFPSFAEGYGLPLTEALALGVPAICSNIPVFREIGGNAPEFIDPLDGLGWLESIERRSGRRITGGSGS
jgi:glycosyltransferase involved in cell wall biosynthesis